MTYQIPLPLVTTPQYSWDNFYVGHNKEVMTLLRQQPQVGQGLIYLWGANDVGKSHLLQATSQKASEAGAKVFYLNLQQVELYTPDILADLNCFDMVCIDDIDHVMGQAKWELALFNLYNMLLDQQSVLIVAAEKPPQDSGVQLVDLLSRLQQGLTFYIQPLNDNDIKQAINEKMQQYGFSGSQEIVDYIANRTQRDISSLVRHFSLLHEASLVEQRALTKPFIKKILGW